MNYYHIRTYTPFCGEEAGVYIAAETEKEYHVKANNAADENTEEEYDELAQESYDNMVRALVEAGGEIRVARELLSQIGRAHV